MVRTMCWLLIASLLPAPLSVDAGEVEFRITEPSGVDRVDWPVTSGIPLARGEVGDASHVALFDADGRELHRWAKPYSAEILTIQGDELFFGAGVGGAKGPFRTDTEGNVFPAAPLVRNLTETTEYLDCPETLTGFDDRSLVVCHLATDAAGRPRRLAWETGCA